MSTSPEAVSERGTLKPRPRLRRREDIPCSAPCLACTGSNKSRSNFPPALRRVGFPGRCTARAPQAGAASRRFPSAAPSARRAVRSSAPGAGPPPRADAPSRALSPGPCVNLPPSSAAAQLCSALTLEAEVQGACAPRHRPLLSAASAAAASALPVIGEHALVDHHDEEGAHAVKASSQQL